MNIEHEGSVSNEQAIAEKEMLGRSLLEKHPELTDMEREVLKNEKDQIHTEVITDESGNERWKKKIDYVRDGNNHDTPEIKAINEQAFTLDDEGRVVGVEGTNLDREHSWTEAREYDDEGVMVKSTGEVTEGEKQGETWETTISSEKVGNYTKKTKKNVGKKMVEGELVDFTTVEVNYTNEFNQSVYGYHEADGEQTMDWGEKPEDLE